MAGHLDVTPPILGCDRQCIADAKVFWAIVMFFGRNQGVTKSLIVLPSVPVIDGQLAPAHASVIRGAYKRSRPHRDQSLSVTVDFRIIAVPDLSPKIKGLSGICRQYSSMARLMPFQYGLA
jgi:hypothetical protein